MEEETCPNCRLRNDPRDPKELKDLESRIHRIQGQLSGIAKMLEDNRYCGDILTQVAAVENALQAVGYQILTTHMNTCVKEDILAGKEGTIEETMSLIKKLK